MTSTHCDSVLRREVSRSLESEIVNAAVQYLMTVSRLCWPLLPAIGRNIVGLSLPASVPDVKKTAPWRLRGGKE